MARVAIGIPAFAERDWLPHTLESLSGQDQKDFEVWVCVNQPAEHWNDPCREESTRDNLETLSWLAERRHRFPFRLHVLDAVHPPLAPEAKRAGVGWARRFLFERAIADMPDDGICISLDADTLLDRRYVSRVVAAFRDYPNALALAAPYFHHAPEEPRRALALLRYEIFLRYYQLNLWRIGSPYAFLPLGSALAFRVDVWRRTGGIPPRKAGEDFYFLQQLRKVGPVIRWIESRVYPSARHSERNPFGTGPVIGGDADSPLAQRYPFYAPELFDLLAQSFARFPTLYREPQLLPIDAFLHERLGGCAPFDRMRRNFGKVDLFVKACHERLDGLRTLQCLRFYHGRQRDPLQAEDAIAGLLSRLGKPDAVPPLDSAHIEEVKRLRGRLCEYEEQYRRNFMRTWDPRARW